MTPQEDLALPAGLALPPALEIGVATSAWQIEGAVAERGRCIWDDFAERPGTIADGSTGEPACDHVHRLEEDLDLMARLGVDAYRFSISWPRVMPEGTGSTSPAGLDFYDRLVDGLLARGIAPVATLYHWDLPSPLQECGGWAGRAVAGHFAEYAGVVAGRLADRVARWATLNEPWCSAFLGHAAGVHAPGWRDGAAAFRAAHHLLLGHGWAVEQLRGRGAREVGIVLNLMPVVASTGAAAGAGAAAAEHVDDIQNHLFLEPLAGRPVPARLVARTQGLTDWSFVQPGDEKAMAAPLDWLGVNYYTVGRVASGWPTGGAGPGEQEVAFPGAPPMHFTPQPPMTEMGWEISPPGLVAALRLAHQALPELDLWVTENGAATGEDDDGTAVHDPERIAYLRDHLDAVLTARQAGLPVRGYYVWSLMDNLEWAFGWTKRFGLVRVEEARQQRREKDSAIWLRQTLARRRS
jgi:beta-glucosidase